MADRDTHDARARDAGHRGMRPATKLAAFALVVGAAFGVGAAVGSFAGPIDVTDAGHGTEVDHGAGSSGATTTLVPIDHDDHGGLTDG